MRKVAPVVALVLLITKVTSQTIVGNWYGVEKDRLVKFTITSDSLRMQAVGFDFNSKGYEEINRQHAGIFQLKDRAVIIFHNVEAENYSALTFTNVKEKQFLEIASNGIATKTDTKEELIQLCEKDTTKLKSELMLIVSEHHIPALRKLPF